MKIFKAILSISLIGILMFSTMGLSVSRHYCMGMLVDESFYIASEGCGMQMDDNNSTSNDALKSGCCDDENLVFQGIDVISVMKNQMDIAPSAFFYTPSLDFTLAPRSLHYTNLSYYPPPEIRPHGKTLLVQVQRFLI